LKLNNKIIEEKLESSNSLDKSTPEESPISHEGRCLIRTKNGTFAFRKIALIGNEIFIYKNQGDSKPKSMHSLINTFIKKMKEEVKKTNE
jgi:hypothetical protein